MAKTETPTNALAATIRDLVETHGRPLRLDEFVKYTSASVDDIRATLNLAEMGRPLHELLLDDGFDDEPSALEEALGIAMSPHDEDELLHSPKESLVALAHPFCERPSLESIELIPLPSDECADCGFFRADHVDAFAQPPAEGIRVNSGDSEATEGIAKKKETMQALPGMPESLAWGVHNGRRVTHGDGKPKGSFRLPDKLAEMTNDEEFVALVRFRFDFDGYRRNPKQEGKTSTLHKTITLEIVAVDSFQGPFPPSS